MQIICADDTGVPHAEITRIEIIAGVEIDALLLDPAEISDRAIIDPKHAR